jgi:tRNA threonylcarbamoyladenosine biosynthesis protein TsaB
VAATAGPRLLVLETSGRAGQVAVFQGATLLALRRLDEARRHARDLAPAVAELLAAQGWKPADVKAVVVSRGPGSYTGLRVGLISAKIFAYATGCQLVAIDTFSAIANQAPDSISRLDVLADAQQSKVYIQPFVRSDGWQAPAPLAIRPLADWLATRDVETPVTGPGLETYADRLPSALPRLMAECWQPRVETVARLGLTRFLDGDTDDPWAVEPLYLRPSSAEEQQAGAPRQQSAEPTA